MVKLKYYGIGISLVVVVIYGIVIFINLNYRNSKIKNILLEIVKLVKEINILDNREDIDNDKS